MRRTPVSALRDPSVEPTASPLGAGALNSGCAHGNLAAMQPNRYADAERGRVLCVAPPHRTTSVLLGALRSNGFEPQLLRESWSVGAAARAGGARAVVLDVERSG